MFWIEISSQSSILDYRYWDEPEIDDLEEFFGSTFDMVMGPQEYYLEQKVVKHPPKEWLESEIRSAKWSLESAQCRLKSLEDTLEIIQK